jgi:RNA polymerase sigma factor (sigma-70 family)
MAERAVALVPAAIAAFLKSHPCLRKAAKLCDLHSAAMMAVCQASFTYDPARSQPTTYYGTAIRHALLKETGRVAKSRELDVRRITLEKAAAREKPTEEPRNELLRTLATMGLEEKHLIEDRILSRQSLRSLAKAAGVDPRTIAKRLRRCLALLEKLSADLP